MRQYLRQSLQGDPQGVVQLCVGAIGLGTGLHAFINPLNLALGVSDLSAKITCLVLDLPASRLFNLRGWSIWV